MGRIGGETLCVELIKRAHLDDRGERRLFQRSVNEMLDDLFSCLKLGRDISL